jgi:hypothetical protein
MSQWSRRPETIDPRPIAVGVIVDLHVVVNADGGKKRSPSAFPIYSNFMPEAPALGSGDPALSRRLDIESHMKSIRDNARCEYLQAIPKSFHAPD